MTERMKLLDSMIMERATHRCPSCTEPTYCAMEAGKSSSSCWCMSIDSPRVPEADYMYVTCQCTECLMKNNKEN